MEESLTATLARRPMTSAARARASALGWGLAAHARATATGSSIDGRRLEAAVLARPLSQVGGALW